MTNGAELFRTFSGPWKKSVKVPHRALQQRTDIQQVWHMWLIQLSFHVFGPLFSERCCRATAEWMKTFFVLAHLMKGWVHRGGRVLLWHEPLFVKLWNLHSVRGSTELMWHVCEREAQRGKGAKRGEVSSAASLNELFALERWRHAAVHRGAWWAGGATSGEPVSVLVSSTWRVGQSPSKLFSVHGEGNGRMDGWRKDLLSYWLSIGYWPGDQSWGEQTLSF